MTRIKTLIIFCLICVHPCLSVAQQRRPAIDYSKFLHTSAKHQAAECNTCHKVPTKDWTEVSAFPDITDYPSHDACLSCHRHRQQFFRGARPPICSVCHSKTSPRDDVRFAFRNPASKLQFTIAFPHDKHQDVIAMLRFSHALQNYYNCTVCHAQRSATFKAVPTDHSSCFNCHWKTQQPVANNCKGCHKPATMPYTPADKPTRISATFIHDNGSGENKPHVAECTTCHINITKPIPPDRKPKPDVPITACTGCHNKRGQRLDLNRELSSLKKDRNFTCSYCHAPNVGNLDPPASHFAISGFEVFKRK